MESGTIMLQELNETGHKEGSAGVSQDNKRENRIKYMCDRMCEKWLSNGYYQARLRVSACAITVLCQGVNHGLRSLNMVDCVFLVSALLHIILTDHLNLQT